MPHELSVDASRLPAALVRWFSELTHEGMFAADRELRIIVWNRWMEVHTERPAASVIGMPLLELYPTSWSGASISPTGRRWPAGSR